ncbi:HAMP domain-containing sensor histidine kinase [Halobacillus rhizosphaerae]|uniref:sensor histidine kinase n=1 Tax=Halobacillus rhizosphaerae TaxID=3064889 RepID=UPI00398ACD1B
MKWIKSLQFKYLMLMFAAVLIVPIMVPLISAVVYLPGIKIEKPNDPYGNFDSFEKRWNEAAEALEGSSKKEIQSALTDLHNEYPDAGMFWVDKEGVTQKTIQVPEEIPLRWSRTDAMEFLKQHYNSDPFTVVAFIGKGHDEGFMVVQLDRDLLGPPATKLSEIYGNIIIAALAIVLVVFIFLSWFFFRKVHRRLIRLKEAMTHKSENGLPHPVEPSNEDEIGQLEISFNEMVEELELSRGRELREENLRRELIANLSHDLRTPLTTIRAQLSEAAPEVTSEKGKNALLSVNKKIDYLGNLIDNLFSITLLTGKKYPFHPQSVEMNRFVRSVAAHWYAVFEQEGFDMQVETLEAPLYWHVDEKWMERILDNLLQNVVRYASEGKFVGVKLEPDSLTIEDHGPGMKQEHESKGAGVGLTIVDLMVKDMKLAWEMNTNADGTKIKISNPAVGRRMAE